MSRRMKEEDAKIEVAERPNFQALKMQLNRIEEKLDHIITSKLSTK
jgi:hypothetical protein